MYFLSYQKKKSKCTSEFSFIRKHIYVIVYVYTRMCAHTQKCTCVRVYLIWGTVDEELILPLWETTSRESAFFELLSLSLSRSPNGRYANKKTNKGTLRRNSTPGLELSVCSLWGRVGELVNRSKWFHRINNGVLSDLEHSRQHWTLKHELPPQDPC